MVLQLFQSLFYWILFFYKQKKEIKLSEKNSFNPYSTGFSSFIKERKALEQETQFSFNPYSTGFSSFIIVLVVVFNIVAFVSILILLDSLLLFLLS